MTKQSREALDAYYMEAESWAKDRQDALRASRRTAWMVAGGAALIAVLEAFALLFLTPLKTVVPYTLLVDRHTGFVQALAPLEPGQVSGDAALTQSFLVQYVIARESFDIDALQANYRKVGLWSAQTARSSYIDAVQASNPDSPLQRYPRSTVIETRVKSVSPIARNVAMVRFDTQRRDAGGAARPPQSWAAIVRYRYSGEPMTLEDRFVNPLGFEVVRYRRDAEAPPFEIEYTRPPVRVVPARPAPVQAVPQPAPAATPPPGPEVEL